MFSTRTAKNEDLTNMEGKDFEIVKVYLYGKGGCLKHLVTDVTLGPLA